MTNKLTKYGIMLIAAVLLVAMAFAGAGAAASTYNTTITTWDELNQNITSWTSTEDELIIVLGNVSGYNSIASDKTYTGIKVAGNVTIMPNSTIGVDEIVLNGTGKGRLFEVSSTGSLTLAGNSTKVLNLTGGNFEISAAQAFGGAILVNGGKLTLNDGAKITNSAVKATQTDAESFGGAVSLQDATFTMNGGNITVCYSHKLGGAVSVKNSTFTMNGGKIADCVANYDGGAVSVDPTSKFTMNGHSVITNCTAYGNQGGAIYCYFGGIVTMNDNSAITNCTAAGKSVSTDGQGGGAICAYGTVIMNDNSTIFNCTATNAGSYTTNGGGVLVRYDGSSRLEMHDNSAITNCTAKSNGAGVFVETGGTFFMDGGKITGSKAVRGGGVYVADGGSFEIEGAAIVKDNTDTSEKANNVYLEKNDLLALVDNFTGNLGIVLVDGAAPAENAQFGVSDSAEFFGAKMIHPDDPASSLKGVVTSDKKLTWAYTEVTVTTWNELADAVSQWTNTVYQRAVKVNGDITDRTADQNKTGIEVKGNVYLIPAVNTAGEFKIDGKQVGRLFDVKADGTLWVTGKSAKVLNLTNATYDGDGGAIYVESKGVLYLLTPNAMITNSEAKNGGAVSLAYDSRNFQPATFYMVNGSIINCTATNGGAVMINQCSHFYLYDGKITGCTATDKGAGVYLQYNANNAYPTTFNMTGGNISDCVYTAGTFNGEYGGLYIAGGKAEIGDKAVIDGIHIRVDEYYGDPKRFTVTIPFQNGGHVKNLSLQYPSNPVWVGAVVAKDGAPSRLNISMSQKYLDMGYYLTTNGNDVIVSSLKNVSTWTQLAENVSAVAQDSVGVIILNDNITDRAAGQNVTGIEVKGHVIIVSNASKDYSINGNGIGRIFNVTSGVLILKGGPNGATLTLTGGNATAAAETNGGAIFANHVNVTVLSGVTITNSTAENGGGVYIVDGILHIGGKATITGNTNAAGSANNVYTNGPDLRLVNDFNGTIGVSYADAVPAAGLKFGIAPAISALDVTVTPAILPGGKFVADTNAYLIGEIKVTGDERNLVWKDTEQHYTPSSSGGSGSTVINQTVVATPKPTVKPTAAPTQKPADNPVVNPTVKPTTQQTQQSPAPFIGLIAGLGAAALIYRLRK